MIRSRRTQLLLAWTFALTVIGYPLAGIAAAVLDLPSAAMSYPFRALVCTLALALVLSEWRARSNGRLHPWLALFWALYVARLLWDIAAGPPDADAALFFFALTTLIPVYGIVRAAGRWDELLTARLVFMLGSLISAAAILIERQGYAADRSLTDMTGRLFLDTVNPITFGHAGVTTLIAAATLHFSGRSAVGRFTLLAGSALAIGCIVLAASRGPVLALAICAFVVAVAQRRWSLAALPILAVLAALSSDGFELVSRFADIDEDDSALERLVLQANALQMFADSPILGSAYAEFLLNTYPHNMFIETAMALGIVGLVLIAGLTAIGLSRMWKRVRVGMTLLPLLFVQYFIGFQFSGALWGSSSFWACLALLLALAVADRPVSGLARSRRLSRPVAPLAGSFDPRLAVQTSTAAA